MQFYLFNKYAVYIKYLFPGLSMERYGCANPHAMVVIILHTFLMFFLLTRSIYILFSINMICVRRVKCPYKTQILNICNFINLLKINMFYFEYGKNFRMKNAAVVSKSHPFLLFGTTGFIISGRP